MASSALPAAPATAPAEGIDPATALQVRKTIYAHAPLTPSDMDLVFECPSEEFLNHMNHL
jgi:hypothetical protein